MLSHSTPHASKNSRAGLGGDKWEEVGTSIWEGGGGGSGDEERANVNSDSPLPESGWSRLVVDI